MLISGATLRVADFNGIVFWFRSTVLCNSVRLRILLPLPARNKPNYFIEITKIAVTGKFYSLLNILL